MSSRLADEHFDSNWRVDELDTEELSGAEDETSSGFFSFELLLSSWARNLDMFNFFFLSCFTNYQQQKYWVYFDMLHVDADDKDRSLR